MRFAITLAVFLSACLFAPAFAVRLTYRDQPGAVRQYSYMISLTPTPTIFKDRTQILPEKPPVSSSMHGAATVIHFTGVETVGTVADDAASVSFSVKNISLAGGDIISNSGFDNTIKRGTWICTPWSFAYERAPNGHADNIRLKVQSSRRQRSSALPGAPDVFAAIVPFLLSPICSTWEYPDRDLVKGERWESALKQIPASNVKIEGTTTSTFMGLALVDGRICADIASDVAFRFPLQTIQRPGVELFYEAGDFTGFVHQYFDFATGETVRCTYSGAIRAFNDKLDSSARYLSLLSIMGSCNLISSRIPLP